MDSILTTIKSMLGIESTVTSFDTDIIVDINSALMSLNQLGLGPAAGFSITNSTAVWNNLLVDAINLEAVKSYIYLKVKLIFDPPTNAALLESIGRQITELEWRLNVQAEQGLYPVIPLEEEDYDDLPYWG